MGFTSGSAGMVVRSGRNSSISLDLKEEEVESDNDGCKAASVLNVRFVFREGVIA